MLTLVPLELRLELELRRELELLLEEEREPELELERLPHHPSHCPITFSVRMTTSNTDINVHNLMLLALETWSAIYSLMKSTN